MSKFQTTPIQKLTEGAKREVEGFAYADLRTESAARVFKTPTLGPDGSRFHVDPVLDDLIQSDESSEVEVQRRVEERLAELRAAAEAEGQARGHEAGFEAGRGEALAQYQIDAEEKLTRLDAVVTSVESMRAHLLKAQERFVLETIQRMAEAVIHREITTDPAYLGRLVHDIVEKVGAKDVVKILVHPSALEAAYAIVPDLEKKYANLKNVSVEANAQLGPNDCAVETDWNRVDATLATQLESLKQALLSGHQGV